MRSDARALQRARKAWLWLAFPLFLTPAAALANDWPHTIARGKPVAVHEAPAEGSAVLAHLEPYAAFQLVEPGNEWSRVQVRGLQPHAWVRTDQIVISAGVLRFHERRFDDALTSFSAEIATESDEIVRSWLRFWAGYTHWRMERHDLALSVFEQVAAAADPPWAPFAFIAQAKLHVASGNLNAAAAAYDRLLAKFPAYKLPDDGYTPYVVDPLSRLRGAGEITRRSRVVQELAEARRQLEGLESQAGVAVPDLAHAWFRLALAEDSIMTVDPYLPPSKLIAREARMAETSYRRVVELLPRSDIAARAAFRLIHFDEPYEWEAAWQARAEWLIGHYGGFVANHGEHELAGEALFHLAIGTWTSGGYPEALRLLIVGSREDLVPALNHLRQWFPDMGYSVGHTAPEGDRAKAREAASLLRRVVDDHPHTPSAPMAQYYLAVIHDYVFNESEAALPLYVSFLDTDPADGRFVEKALERIRVLSSPVR